MLFSEDLVEGMFAMKASLLNPTYRRWQMARPESQWSISLS